MKLLSQMTDKEIHLKKINTKRECNRLARSRGFKNYKQMCGEE
jgi:hypothetical protein